MLHRATYDMLKKILQDDYLGSPIKIKYLQVGFFKIVYMGLRGYGDQICHLKIIY